MAPATVSIAPEFAFILVTATIVGYIARMTGQPTLVGYIVAGLLLGPVVLDVVSETELVSLLSELGLGFLLFLLGIELKLESIRDVFQPVVTIGIGQRVIQTTLAFVVAFALGFTFVQSVVIALAINVGSTAVIVKVLTDKDEISTLPGRLDVGVLIFQDLYLIVVLALLSAESLANPAAIARSLLTIFALMSFIAVFSAASSRYVLPPLFERIANDEDAFFVVGIAWAFLFISISVSLDLSLEVGAFLAGISLAQLPYSSELEQRIRPLTDFFMVIFFSSIGLRLAADDLFAYWQEALLTSVALMVGNFLIMFYLINRVGFTPETAFKGSINMTQISEFALVIGALAVGQGYIGVRILGYLSLAAVISMGLSTYLINYNHELYRLAEPYLRRFESEQKRDIEITAYRNHAVVVGYDELSRQALPLLAEHFEQVVVIDRNPANIDELEQSPYEYIYGDFKYGELRRSAGIEKAAFVLSTSIQTEISELILAEVNEKATAFVEAKRVEDAIELYNAGADYVILGDVLTGDRTNEYLKLYLYDEEFFGDVVRPRLERICNRGGVPDG